MTGDGGDALMSERFGSLHALEKERRTNILSLRHRLDADTQAAIERRNLMSNTLMRNIPTSVRIALYRRSGPRCEMCGLRKRDTTVSHRVAGGMGGSTIEQYRLSNLIRACVTCHLGRIERQPTEAFTMGWKVHHGQDPAEQPIYLAGVWVLLDDVGGITECAPPADAPEQTATASLGRRRGR